MKSMEPNKTKSSILKAFTALVVVALGGLGLWKLSTGGDEDNKPVQQPADNATPATNYGNYKDGIYSATGNYNSPQGNERVAVTVTLKNNIVTDTTFNGQSSSRRSQSYMNKFSSGFSTLVIGKPIDQVSLTVVNGSSLTPIGFMNALAKIKAQAKA